MNPLYEDGIFLDSMFGKYAKRILKDIELPPGGNIVGNSKPTMHRLFQILQRMLQSVREKRAAPSPNRL